MDFSAWLSGIGRKSCHKCRAIFKKDSTPSRWNPNPVQKKPPCHTCKPDLLPENSPAVELYYRCSDQWLTSADGRATGLSIPAIESFMRIAGVEQQDQLHLLDEVQAIGREILRLVREEEENKPVTDTTSNAETENRSHRRR